LIPVWRSLGVCRNNVLL